MQKSSERAKREAAFFDKLAKVDSEYWGYCTPAGEYRLKLRAQLFKTYLKYEKPIKILEVGCGFGAITKFLLHKKIQIYATDISKESIRRAKQNVQAKGVVFKTEDLCRLSFKANAFDYVFGVSILHHVDLQLALSETLRVLKPGGKMIFSEPNMANPQVFLERNIGFLRTLMKNSPDETAFLRGNLRQEIIKAGFSDVSVRPFDFIYPAIPSSLLPAAKAVSDFLETVPLIKEIAGSLLITAEKPLSS